MVLSATPELGEFGWGIRSIGRGIKKAAKKTGRVVKKGGKFAYKYSGTKFIVKSNIALAKFSAKLALLPLKYLLKAAMTVGRTLCKAPPQVLELACTQANIDPAFIPLFCKAVKENKFSLGSVRRLLPPALKVAAKMAAAGMFPPIVPVLAVAKRIPYVGKFCGSDVDLTGVDTRLTRQAMDAMQIVALADYLGCLDDADAETLGLGPDERATLHDLLAGQVELAEATAADRNAMVLGGVTAGATILGFYLLFR